MKLASGDSAVHKRSHRERARLTRAHGLTYLRAQEEAAIERFHWANNAIAEKVSNAGIGRRGLTARGARTLPSADVLARLGHFPD